MSILKIFIFIIVIGIINSFFLAYHSLKGKPYCFGLPDEWCEKVQKSKYNMIFDIPIPYLVLEILFFISLFLVLYYLGFFSLIPLYILGTFGFLISLYFFYMQVVVLKAFCTWCVVSAIVFTLIFILQWML